MTYRLKLNLPCIKQQLFSNLSQSLTYGYLVEKKDLPVNKVSILNPLLGLS